MRRWRGSVETSNAFKKSKSATPKADADWMQERTCSSKIKRAYSILNTGNRECRQVLRWFRKRPVKILIVRKWSQVPSLALATKACAHWVRLSKGHQSRDAITYSGHNRTANWTLRSADEPIQKRNCLSHWRMRIKRLIQRWNKLKSLTHLQPSSVLKTTK